jgi:hypothetical protein
MTKPILSLSDVAALLGCPSEAAALRLIHRHGPRHSKLGKRVLIRLETLLADLAAREVSRPVAIPPPRLDGAAARLRRSDVGGLQRAATRLRKKSEAA